MSRSKRILITAIAVLAVGCWLFFGSYPIVNNPPPSGPIIAFGDSLTYGVGAQAGRSYPDQLAELIGRPVSNRGVPGNSIADGVDRLEIDVLVEEPGIVLVGLGGNDLLKLMDLDKSFVKLEGIVRRIQSRGAMVVLVGLKALTPIGGVGGRYKKLARQTGCLYVPDILGGIFGQRDLMSSDRIHPNEEGYGRMAQRVAKALEPYL
jgi:acyl-CoA thioesterase-1